MTRSARVLLSIYGWWALVVLPAVLILAGVFGEAGPDSDFTAAQILVWVVFYCAQLAMLVVVVARAVGHLRMWWLFVASLLPWTVTWAAPYGIGWGLLWIGVAGILALVMVLLALRSLRLEEHGRQVTATVVKVLPDRMNLVVNNIYVRRRLLLDIPAADGTTYQGVLPMLCEIGTSPAPGDTFRLRVDPDDPKHFALDPRERAST